MASRSEQARQDQATQQRRDAACAKIHALFDDIRNDPHVVITALVEAIADESADIVELRRKGWQTKARDLNMAAEIVADWRTRLQEYTPPTPIEGPGTVMTRG